MKVQVLNLDGSAAAGDIELNDAVFGLEPRADILHRVVTWQLENRRGIARAPPAAAAAAATRTSVTSARSTRIVSVGPKRSDSDPSGLQGGGKRNGNG